jgi:hypothetical protein
MDAHPSFPCHDPNVTEKRRRPQFSVSGPSMKGSYAAPYENPD